MKETEEIRKCNITYNPGKQRGGGGVYKNERNM